MGSGKKLDFIDNSEGLFSEEGIAFIKEYFVKEMPFFKLIDTYNDPHGYWGAIFGDINTKIMIGSERSFIDFSVEIYGRQCLSELMDFDERLTLLKKTSRINFIFLIDRIKQFIESRKNLIPVL